MPLPTLDELESRWQPLSQDAVRARFTLYRALGMNQNFDAHPRPEAHKRIARLHLRAGDFYPHQFATVTRTWHAALKLPVASATVSCSQ
jgi:hypothetical protein